MKKGLASGEAFLRQADFRIAAIAPNRTANQHLGGIPIPCFFNHEALRECK